MPTKPDIDFAFVPEHQREIDERLHNWARWCIGRPFRWTSPIFRLAKPAQHWEPVDVRADVDIIDASRLEKGVAALPEKHREAVRWCYVYRSPPWKACRLLAVQQDTLYRLVADGRQMLVNRGI